MSETERLLFRPFAPEHEDTLFEQWNEPSVRKYLFDDEPVPREMVRAPIYALLPHHRGRGLATEAARAVLDLAFRECGLAEIFAGADAPNGASFRVMERLGMQPFGDIVVGGRPTPYYRVSRDAFAVASPVAQNARSPSKSTR
jgi:RimJ/RimL family protein N-acetyltransferase